MDVDGDDDGTQRVAPVKNYGVTVDFSDLEDEEKEVRVAFFALPACFPDSQCRAAGRVHRSGGDAPVRDHLDPIRDGQDLGQSQGYRAVCLYSLCALVKWLTSRLVPRLGDSEARFKEIDGEFEKAREAAKEAKEAFTALKKERCTLFNKAYDHISDRIDKVYKELTKGAAAPTGGVAYLTLDDSEVRPPRDVLIWKMLICTWWGQEPYLHGIKYHAMPPMKRFRDVR